MRLKIMTMACVLPMMAMAQHNMQWQRVEVTNELDSMPDTQAMAILAKYKPAVDSIMAPVLGESLVGMSARRPESLLSNWVADAMVENSTFHDGKRADMGLVNVGGLRSNMPEGTVRRGDVIKISPFENKLAIVELTGADLMELFRNIASIKGEGVSREVRLVITSDGKLVSAKLNGKKIKAKKTYRVATLDYLAEGNDKMVALKRAKHLWVSDTLAREAMMQSILKAKTITAAIEGRITIKD